ncbi:type II toxin-antitoxin system death-on-curing family toxin [Nakamurella multipartita]|uniref:Death-on-curing family protein n=1 Tax=Nakamurella multipartita (strain ATCC 700099 / DSM 44233 / CIP 104796 / JCM 9543 / NBRC 105858 / Y-104) TaxID=479431 RepID=C8XH44_NAKMY|nr:type II toxin-antitoxin system death-on-curing family toxin [Nakamurella multipartita]ACV78250.1 death-on-curing family protein [Nakamurella multipartita DSM 44233]HOZ57521.1 type II toxin-antitoxin system death-on-curing family toxin [Nakamurella multipartita]
MTRFLSAEDVLAIARVAIGGDPAVRDLGLLDSACHRPSSTVFGEDAYPTLTLKAAALLHSLTANHPFVDGNKRTAWLATVVFLRDNGATVVAPDAYDGQITDLVLALAAGELRDVNDIADRLAAMVNRPS